MKDLTLLLSISMFSLLLCAFPTLADSPADSLSTSQTSDEDPTFVEELKVELREISDLLDVSEYDQILERCATLLEQQRSRFPDGSYAEAVILDHMVIASYRSGAVMEDGVVEMALRAVQLKETAEGPDSENLATSLMHLANLLNERRDCREAIPHYDHAIAILSGEPEKNAAEIAVLLSSEGVAWRRVGDYEQAVRLYEQALDIQQEALGENHPHVATTLNNLANVWVQLGDYTPARQAHERALRIRQAFFGDDHEWVGESWNNYSSVLGYMGEWDEAIRAQEKSIKIIGDKLGEEHQRFWWVTQNLGLIYLDMGDYLGAMPIFESVLEAFRERYGEEHIETGYIGESLAGAYFGTGNYEKALELYTLSLRICEATWGHDNAEAAGSCEHVGRCHAELGDLDKAFEYLRRSLQISEESLDPDSPLLSSRLHRLAELHLRRNAYDEALAAALRSEDILRASLGNDHPLLAEALLLKAKALRAGGQDEEAIQSALLAETISRDHLQATMRVLSEAYALDYATSRTVGLDQALSILQPLESGERSGRVLDAVMRSRAVVLDEYAARNHNISLLSEASTAELTGRSLALRERLANLVLRGPGWEETDAYRTLMDEARAELNQVERELALVSAESRQASQAHLTGLSQVQQSLDGQSVLISFTRYTKSDAVDTDEAPQASYKAFVLTGQRAHPVAVELGDAKEIDALVAAWRDHASLGGLDAAPYSGAIEQTIASRGFVRVSHDVSQRVEDYRDVASALRNRIWDPLTSQLGDCNRVFLVPDGSLHLVNFASLPVDDGRFLLEEDLLLHTLDTERSLVRPPAGGDRDLRALLVGDPDFDLALSAEPAASVAVADKRSASQFSILADLGFDPLPHARHEVDVLREYWNEVDETGAARAKVLVGSDATEQAVKEQLGESHVLHLATHGFFLPARSDVVGSEDSRFPDWRSALARSGLALGGANNWRQAPSGQDDGILTAEEVSALDLTDVEWAVLSACDTGLGSIAARGEGVFGLRRAFTLAGARTVIMSLWSVRDDSAADWMSALYRMRLQEKFDTALAVRSASRAILSERRAAGQSAHPYYWAGFVAVGDWR